MPLDLKFPLGRRSGADLVGLDIQPGFIAAATVQVNGSILAQRVAATTLPADVVREGEVADEGALSEALREMFSKSGLGKRVRVGVANQRTVMRTLQLPPISDRKELAAAVNFQAQDQVPMPLANAVLDFHSLGVVDTHAGLQPQGIDLSAFALIRSLHRAGDEQSERVLYLNVDGLTNLAIADGLICSFTRVVGGGIEAMASELAERRGIPVADAREQVLSFDLNSSPAELDLPAELEPEEEAQPALDAEQEEEGAVSEEEHTALEAGASFAELVAQPSAPEPSPAEPDGDDDVRGVVENAIRDIAGEVRNSLDFHRSQDQGGEVSHVVLSGAALDLPGFAEALQMALDVEVRSESVGVLDVHPTDEVSPHRLAVAAGLATAEAPR
jgi:type IV pilus assembly protein PilM